MPPLPTSYHSEGSQAHVASPAAPTESATKPTSSTPSRHPSCQASRRGIAAVYQRRPHSGTSTAAEFPAQVFEPSSTGRARDSTLGAGPLWLSEGSSPLHSGERRVKQRLNWDGGNLLAEPTVMSRALPRGRRTRAVGPPSLAYDRTLACRRHPHCPLLARSLTGEGRRTPASATPTHEDTHTKTQKRTREDTILYAEGLDGKF